MAGPTHDVLTGLPNRETFLAHLRRRLDDAERVPLAVLVFDVAGFAAMNDSRGRGAGDRVLREIAVRLDGALRPTDVVARIGGDEFGALCLGVDEDEARALAHMAASAVTPPIALEGITLEVSVHTGISVLPADLPAPDAETLLAEAERQAGPGTSG